MPRFYLLKGDYRDMPFMVLGSWFWVQMYLESPVTENSQLQNMGQWEPDHGFRVEGLGV